MQVIENGVSRILIPEKGYKLVNKRTGKQMTKVYMGKLDSIDNYTEIIDDKYANMDFVVELDELKEVLTDDKARNEVSVELLLTSIDELYMKIESILEIIQANEASNNKE